MLSMNMNQAIRRTVQTIHGFLIEEPSVYLSLLKD